MGSLISSLEPEVKKVAISGHKDQLLIRIPKLIADSVGIDKGDQIVFSIDRSEATRGKPVSERFSMEYVKLKKKVTRKRRKNGKKAGRSKKAAPA